MATGRYELRDTENPHWRGQRFSTLERAQAALDNAVPPGRFKIIDRTPEPFDSQIDYPERHTNHPVI